MTDESLSCVSCGRRFTLSYNEQRSYREKHLEFPKRCPKCRSRRKYEKHSGQSQRMVTPIYTYGDFVLKNRPLDNNKPKEPEKKNEIASSHAQSTEHLDNKKHDPYIALLLSIIFLGGGGHIYLGQKKKGVLIIICTLIPIFGTVIWLLGCCDAYILAKKITNGETLQDWQFFWSR